MTYLKLKHSIFIFIFLGFSVLKTEAQEGQITVNQSSEITSLMALKKEANASVEDSDRYKIQIYSGNRSGAEKALSSYRGKYTWSSKMVYQEPNYKVWAGNFRTRIEADRALIKVKKKFVSAFIFKPRKKKKN